MYLMLTELQLKYNKNFAIQVNVVKYKKSIKGLFSPVCKKFNKAVSFWAIKYIKTEGDQI